MPRNLNTATLALLATKTGLDPYLIIELPWGSYADRTIGEIKGKVLEVNNLDEVLRTDIGGGRSGNITVTLDDSDGEFATILENLDIHKLPVKIHQAINNEKFLLFDGQISSPIEWDEGQRTFKFDCLNVIEDFEVGFAPEDAQIANLHQSLIGKPWPLGFGTVNYVPALPLQLMPVTITYDAFGLLDLGLFAQLARLNAQKSRLAGEAAKEREMALGLLIAAAFAHFAGDTDSEEFDLSTSLALQNSANQKEAEASAINPESIAITALINDQGRYDPFNYSAILGYITTATSIGALITGEFSNVFTFKGDTKNGISVPSLNFADSHSPIITLTSRTPLKIIVNDQFPPEGNFKVRINDAIFDARITRHDTKFSNMYLTYTPPQIRAPVSLDQKTYQIIGSTAPKQGFSYFPSGSSVTIISDYPLKHVCNIIPSQVTGVYAYRSFNGIRKLSLVPQEYYSVTVDSSGSGHANYQQTDNPYVPKTRFASWFRPTIITLKQSLSTISYIKDIQISRLADVLKEIQTAVYLKPYPSRILPLEEWEDDIYVSYNSLVGPNTSDILTWLIDTYTTKTWDRPSFFHVHTALANFPSNFVLFDRKNILQQLNEIATQAMCIIYLKDNTFYIKYLPEMSDPTDSITADDILDKTLSIVGSGTEDLITRYIATWRPDYTPENQENRIQIKTNVLKYGLHSTTEDYYIYNVHYLVRKSLTYWLIIKSNTWKIINFKTPITKLNIETLDTITIDLPGLHISNNPVDGVVQSAVYDSVNNEISMTVWLPIRFGEMEPYIFAFPANATETDVYPTHKDLTSGGGTGGLYDFGAPNLPNFTGGDSGNNGGFVDEAADRIQGPTNAEYNGLNLMSNPLRRPADSVVTGPVTPYQVPTIQVPNESRPNYNYDLEDYRVKLSPSEDTSPSGSSAFPGKINSGSGDTYNVAVYEGGLAAKPKTVKDVKQLQIDSGESIPPGTWVIVVKVAGKYYMQTPIWL